MRSLDRAPGTDGYSEIVAFAADSWERIGFVDDHRHVLHLIPAPGCAVLDVGSVTGRGAAWFAARGDRVMAVEPVDALRSLAEQLHPSADIEWVDDALPDLAVTRKQGERFELVVLTAVWMHLDKRERQVAMRSLATLVASRGTIVMSLRHGATPLGRRMFEVTADETIALAAESDLECVLNIEADSAQAVNRDRGVTWTWLAFRSA